MERNKRLSEYFTNDWGPKHKVITDIAEEIAYYDDEDLIWLNKQALSTFPAKKGDRHGVLSHAKLMDVADKVQRCNGDIYDKAVCLLKEIALSHAFASGNRRTALVACASFLKGNGADVGIVDDPINSRTFIGIREHFYSDDEIKRWVRYGEIRPFDKRKFKQKTS